MADGPFDPGPNSPNWMLLGLMALVLLCACVFIACVGRG